MQKGSGHRIEGFSILSIISTVTSSQRPHRRARRSGFSLIEILVAVTLLLIITVIISMVFQQAGGAWSSGTAQAKAESAVRAVLGSIERDLLNAVDARDYGYANPYSAGSSIAFIALQHLYNHKTPEKSGRTACLIEYDFDNKLVYRAVTPLKFGGWSDPAAGVATYTADTASDYATAGDPPAINSGMPLEELNFEVVKNPADDQALPLRIDVKARASRAADIFTISGVSSGRNQELESAGSKKSDDIRVGGTL